jgi:hypothetical protein
VKARVLLSVAALVLGGSLAGCGGSNKPAVCGSVDDLKTSLGDLKAISITSSGAVSDLEKSLTTIKGNFDTVKTDAKSQFSTQIQAVDSSYAAMKTAADAAVASPSVTTIATAAAALSTFSTSAQTLVSDVQATC